MIISRAYKAELDPNNKQATAFVRCCGASRFVYNWALAEWNAWFDAGIRPLSEARLKKYFNQMIKDELCPWIRETPYYLTESAFRNLGRAFDNFFRKRKNGDVARKIAEMKRQGKWDRHVKRMLAKGGRGIQLEPGYPKFKARGRDDSFQVRGIKVESDRVYIPGARGNPIGWIRLKERDYIPVSGNGSRFHTYATISRRAGRWYVSVQMDEEIPDPTNGSTLVVGLDMGIKALAVCSDGTVYENPRPLREAQRKLKRLQREQSRRNKGGANWKKTKTKIAKQHARVANIRKHVLHNISHDVVVNKHPAVVVIEDLNVSGMVKNHHLAQAIMDVGFSELRRQIEYKAEWHGVEVVTADRWFPSSKLCRHCGCINDGLTLADRKWTCDCGAVLDRDLNAAKNLAALVNRETHGDCLGS